MIEIAHSLNLSIPEWEEATVDMLKPNANKDSFWQDPFVGLYNKDFIDEVSLKLKGTPFKQDETSNSEVYSYSYQSSKGPVTLKTHFEETSLSKEQFEKENKDMNQYYFKDYIFYQERSLNGSVIGIAKSYFKANQFLQIDYSYPEDDIEAKTTLHHVLKYIRLRST